MQISKKIILSLIMIFLTFSLSELSLTFLTAKNYKLKLLTYNPKTATGHQRIDSLETLSKTTTCYLPPGSVVNGFVTNSRGFLTPEITYEKPSDTYRVLLIGDSYAYGTIPYPLTFIRVVEKKLKEKLGTDKKIEVINLGIACTGPGTYERVLALEGMKYDPDLILVSFFVGNDLTDDVVLNSNIDQLHIQSSASWYEKLNIYNLVKNLLVMHSSLEKVTTSKTEAANKESWGTYTGEGTTDYNPTTPILTEDHYQRISKDKLYLFIRDYEAYGQSFSNVQSTLNEINKLANNYHKDLIYLLFPDELQFDVDHVMSLATQDEKKKIDIELPQKEIISYFSKNNQKYIDFYSFLKSQSEPHSFYQPRDEHLNSLGNEIVTDSIVEEIIKKYQKSE